MICSSRQWWVGGGAEYTEHTLSRYNFSSQCRAKHCREFDSLSCACIGVEKEHVRRAVS